MFKLSFRGASLPLLAVGAGLGFALVGCGGGSTNLPTPGSGAGGLGTAGGTTGGNGGGTNGGGGNNGAQLGANSIVFTSTRDGNPEIYSINVDGTNPQRLTTNASTDEAPSRSANGRRITFSSTRDGNPEIYVMNADGSGVQRLTADLGPVGQEPIDRNPVFSPDGQSILWESFRGQQRRLFIMDATGANQRPITFADGGQFSFDGAWNPDSRRVLGFLLGDQASGPNDLALITPATTATGNATAQFLRQGTGASHARYAPDGSRIVYSSVTPGTEAFLFLLSPDGNTIVRGPSGGANQQGPSFSPDGTRLAWQGNVPDGGGRQIYIGAVTAGATQGTGTPITNSTQGENYDASWTQ